MFDFITNYFSFSKKGTSTYLFKIEKHLFNIDEYFLKKLYEIGVMRIAQKIHRSFKYKDNLYNIIKKL